MASCIVDAIYEAAVVPARWPGVIEQIAAATGSFGGSLFMTGTADTAVAASENCAEHLDALLQEGWSSCNIRAQRLIAAAEVGFLCDADVASPEEIEHHPIYRDFLRPRGLGWASGTHIVGMDDDIAVFSIDRLYKQGPFEKPTIAFLDSLRPHIARSLLFSRKFQAQVVTSSISALEAAGTPAAAIDAHGRVKVMGERFAGFSDRIRTGPLDMLHIADEVAKKLLKRALSELAGGYAPPMSVGVKGREDQAPFVLHIAPVRGYGRDLFVDCAYILVIVPLNQPGLPFRALVQQLYDFTPAEARIAESVLAGSSVARIALIHEVAVETVRSQIKSILAKTGMSRQSEFVARFSSFSSV